MRNIFRKKLRFNVGDNVVVDGMVGKISDIEGNMARVSISSLNGVEVICPIKILEYATKDFVGSDNGRIKELLKDILSTDDIPDELSSFLKDELTSLNKKMVNSLDKSFDALCKDMLEIGIILTKEEMCKVQIFFNNNIKALLEVVRHSTEESNSTLDFKSIDRYIDNLDSYIINGEHVLNEYLKLKKSKH